MSLTITNLESALVPNKAVSAAVVTVGAAASSVPALHAGTDVVLVTLEGGDLRVTYDGSTPTASVGHLLMYGWPVYWNRTVAEAVQWVAAGADVTVRLTQMKYRRSLAKAAELPTLPFSKLFEAVVRLKELDPATAGLSAAQEELVADHITQALREAWEFDFWPDLTPTEKRPVVEEILTDDDGNTEGTLRYVPRRPAGYWAIGAAQTVSMRNPAATDGPGYLNFAVSRNGLELGELGGDSVWVRYRIETPTFTREAWAADTAYSAGAVRYWADTGECYEAVQDVPATGGITPANLEYWDRLPVPKLFFNYARLAAAAYWMQETGEEDKAARRFALAGNELARLEDVEFGQQGQHARASYAGYGAAGGVI